MGTKRRKPRDNRLADRYRNGEFDPERVFEKDDDRSQQFSARSKHAEQNKIVATQAMRADAAALAPVNPAVRTGAVTLVYSLYCDVTGDDGVLYLCTTRKTLNKLTAGGIVVGDRIDFLPTGNIDESGTHRRRRRAGAAPVDDPHPRRQLQRQKNPSRSLPTPVRC